jgi:hypothetical protein
VSRPQRLSHGTTNQRVFELVAGDDLPARRVLDVDGRLPYPDASFDVACSIEVIEHLEDQFAFARELYRVLKPGGRAIVTTPNVLNLNSRVRMLHSGMAVLFDPLPLASADPVHTSGHIHPIGFYYLGYVFHRAGFRQLRVPPRPDQEVGRGMADSARALHIPRARPCRPAAAAAPPGRVRGKPRVAPAAEQHGHADLAERGAGGGEVMLGLYLFAAILGTGLLLFGLVAGGDGDAHTGAGDAGVHHDHPLIADAEHPGGGEWLLGLFRPRNLMFGFSGFGLTGTLLTLVGSGAAATLLAAVGMGAGFFVVSHAVFTFLRRSESAVEALSDTQLMGERARVTLPLEPGRLGRVACLVAGREVHLTARLGPQAPGAVPGGAEVIVVRVENGVAEVLLPEQYDRLLSA